MVMCGMVMVIVFVVVGEVSVLVIRIRFLCMVVNFLINGGKRE